MFIRRYCKIAGIIIMAVLLAGAALVYLPYPLLAVKSSSVELAIVPGQSLGSITSKLIEQNLIVSRYIFGLYVRISGNSKKLQAGDYLITRPISISGLVNIFSKGLAQSNDVNVTIPEGTNIADIGKIFAETGLIKRNALLTWSAISQEGNLFPDTYRFKRPETGNYVPVQEIIIKMKNNFNTKTADIQALHLGSQGGADSGYQTLIIASILEKEVKTETDMRLVAGIIKKRIKLGMPLQVDATVAYGACLSKWRVGKYCDVSLANIVDNIALDTEYNTYIRKGLPIGPISNPGLKALRAALNPTLSDYLYYLTAKDGTTIFSKTAAEHLKARQKYLLN